MTSKRLTDEQFVHRFWQRVDKKGNCWGWTAASAYNGYGAFQGRIDGVQFYRAHRYSWHLHNGPIPKGLLVRHTCDNAACVRPDHLLLGTYYDNNHDTIRSGRSNRGERQGHSKLTEAQVRFIRESDDRPGVLGLKFGVHPTAITAVRTRKNLAWLI